MVLRRQLHAMGLRYRVCTRPLPRVRRTVDIVFRPVRIAVEVRGCFWHGCPEHYRRPATNTAFWDSKVERNIARDADTEGQLTAADWELIVVWEHEPADQAAARVAAAINSRRHTPRQLIACGLPLSAGSSAMHGQQAVVTQATASPTSTSPHAA